MEADHHAARGHPPAGNLVALSHLHGLGDTPRQPVACSIIQLGYVAASISCFTAVTLKCPTGKPSLTIFQASC